MTMDKRKARAEAEAMPPDMLRDAALVILGDGADLSLEALMVSQNIHIVAMTVHDGTPRWHAFVDGPGPMDDNHYFDVYSDDASADGATPMEAALRGIIAHSLRRA